MIKGLLFDFDGLILDTEWSIFQSWQELYQSNGALLDPEDWISAVGTLDDEKDYFDQIEDQTGLHRDWEPISTKRRQRELDLIAGQPILPGVIDYLQAAQDAGLKLGIASSSTWAWVSGHLHQRGLFEYFDVIHTREQVTRFKPDPEPYLNLLSALELKPGQAIALEDSLPGVLSAKRAGLFCVAVPNLITRLHPLDSADIMLESLEQMSLQALLKHVNGVS